MNVKVIQPFADKHTGAIHKMGEEFTVTKERYDKINRTSLGILVEEVKEAAKKTAKK